ncbi:MAG: serine/threonine protein kinase [Acidobacteriia bacterium]|nr:serine/threonine protein kinase [Terriglobia bacterium]
MNFLPDPVLDHLRNVIGLPDFSQTRYRLEREIGRGGMGVVFAAHDETLHRRVAIKVVAKGVLQEARIIASLEHPGIVPVHDAGELPGGQFFYAMKLVDGVRLDQHLERESSLANRLRLFQRVCDTVAFAHSRGVVHRDLKPQNIMVGAYGEVLILDWGVARAVSTAGGNEEPDGTVVGTKHYMAPEQASGRTAEIGPASDIYSLGVILRGLLNPPAPRPLLAIAAKASAVDPSQRYQEALALGREIGLFLDREPVSAYRESSFERAQRFAARNPTLLILITAYVVVRFFLFFLRFL